MTYTHQSSSSLPFKLPLTPIPAGHLELTIRELYTDRWITIVVPETYRIEQVKYEAMFKLGLFDHECEGVTTLSGRNETSFRDAEHGQGKEEIMTRPSIESSDNSSLKSKLGPVRPSSTSLKASTRSVISRRSSSPSSLHTALSNKSASISSQALSPLPLPLPAFHSFTTMTNPSSPCSSIDHPEPSFHPQEPHHNSTSSNIQAQQDTFPNLPYESEVFSTNYAILLGRRSSVTVPSFSPNTKTVNPTCSISTSPMTNLAYSRVGKIGKGMMNKVKRHRSVTVGKIEFENRGLKAPLGEREKREREKWLLDRYRLVNAIVGCHSDEVALVGKKCKPFDLLTLLPRHISFDPPLEKYHHSYLLIEQVWVFKKEIDSLTGGIDGIWNEPAKSWSRRSLRVCEGYLSIQRGSAVERVYKLPALAVRTASPKYTSLGTVIDLDRIILLRFDGNRSILLRPDSNNDFKSLMRVLGEEDNEWLEPGDDIEWRKNAVNLAFASNHNLLNPDSKSAVLRDRRSSFIRMTAPKHASISLQPISAPNEKSTSFRFPIRDPLAPIQPLSSSSSSTSIQSGLTRERKKTSSLFSSTAVEAEGDDDRLLGSESSNRKRRSTLIPGDRSYSFESTRRVTMSQNNSTSSSSQGEPKACFAADSENDDRDSEEELFRQRATTKKSIVFDKDKELEGMMRRKKQNGMLQARGALIG